jgi:hypothetical protein
MATSPIYGWAEPDNTDLVKNGALAIRTLGNAIDTTMGTMVAKTIIDAKGDLIAGSAADTALRLAVGSNGETLVADSSTSTGLRYTAGNPIPNPVLNSSLQVAQRGISFTATGYTMDRWYFSTTGTPATFAVTRQNTGDTTNLPNIQFCARVSRNSGQTNTGSFFFSQSFESVNSIPYAGKIVTFSFYARKGADYSQSSSNLNVVLQSGTGTDQNLAGGLTGSVNVISSTATLTTTWQRFTFTGTVGATATQLGLYFSLVPVGTAGAADYFEVTGVQIDIGSVALPFRTNGATIQGELAACQRYYYRITGNSGGYIAIQQDAVSRGTATNDGLIKNPVPLRIIPTAAIEYGGTQYLETYYGSGGGKTITAITLDTPTSIYNTAVQLTTGTSFTAAARLIWYFANSTTAYIGVSAEL